MKFLDTTNCSKSKSLINSITAYNCVAQTFLPVLFRVNFSINIQLGLQSRSVTISRRSMDRSMVQLRNKKPQDFWILESTLFTAYAIVFIAWLHSPVECLARLFSFFELASSCWTSRVSVHTRETRNSLGGKCNKVTNVISLCIQV